MYMVPIQMRSMYTQIHGMKLDGWVDRWANENVSDKGELLPFSPSIPGIKYCKCCNMFWMAAHLKNIECVFCVCVREKERSWKWELRTYEESIRECQLSFIWLFWMFILWIGSHEWGPLGRRQNAVRQVCILLHYYSCYCRCNISSDSPNRWISQIRGANLHHHKRAPPSYHMWLRRRQWSWWGGKKWHRGEKRDWGEGKRIER